MDISKGDALLIPTNDGGKHLYFVLNDPEKDPPHQVLLVNVTTYHQKHYEDSTCLLNSSDHPFLTHESYVAYSLCTQASKASIVRNINNGLHTLNQRATEALMEKIINGVYASPRTKQFAKDFLDRVS